MDQMCSLIETQLPTHRCSAHHLRTRYLYEEWKGTIALPLNSCLNSCTRTRQLGSVHMDIFTFVPFETYVYTLWTTTAKKGSFCHCRFIRNDWSWFGTVRNQLRNIWPSDPWLVVISLVSIWPRPFGSHVLLSLPHRSCDRDGLLPGSLVFWKRYILDKTHWYVWGIRLIYDNVTYVRYISRISCGVCLVTLDTYIVPKKISLREKATVC